MPLFIYIYLYGAIVFVGDGIIVGTLSSEITYSCWCICIRLLPERDVINAVIV
jgi:hypothetical protein